MILILSLELAFLLLCVESSLIFEINLAGYYYYAETQKNIARRGGYIILQSCSTGTRQIVLLRGTIVERALVIIILLLSLSQLLTTQSIYAVGMAQNCVFCRKLCVNVYLSKSLKQKCW